MRLLDDTDTPIPFPIHTRSLVCRHATAFAFAFAPLPVMTTVQYLDLPPTRAPCLLLLVHCLIVHIFASSKALLLARKGCAHSLRPLPGSHLALGLS
ncbi:hypothetical protein V8C43DRAFT_292738 [Trichoderma afarasin]